MSRKKRYSASRWAGSMDEPERGEFDTCEEAEAFVAGYPCNSIACNVPIPLEAFRDWMVKLEPE